jgi:hypothetical protein
LNLGTGIIGGPKAASVVYASFGMSASNPASSYTFSSRNTGTASAKRTMVLMLTWAPMTSGTFGDCQIDGNNMSLRASLGGGTQRVYTYPWPTGTTATIVTTIASGDFRYCYWAMWAAYDLKSESPTDTYYDIPSIANPYLGNVDVSAGGIAVGLSADVASGAYTWTGLTEDLDTTGGVSSANRLSAASGAFKQAQTPLNVTTTKSQIHRHALASFR